MYQYSLCVCVCTYVRVGVEMKTFINWIAFISWKEEEEKSTYSSFVKPTGEVTSDNG